MERESQSDWQELNLVELERSKLKMERGYHKLWKISSKLEESVKSRLWFMVVSERTEELFRWSFQRAGSWFWKKRQRTSSKSWSSFDESSKCRCWVANVSRCLNFWVYTFFFCFRCLFVDFILFFSVVSIFSSVSFMFESFHESYLIIFVLSVSTVDGGNFVLCLTISTFGLANKVLTISLYMTGVHTGE